MNQPTALAAIRGRNASRTSSMRRIIRHACSAAFSNAASLTILILGCIAIEVYAVLDRPKGVAISCLTVMPWLAAMFYNLHKKGGTL